MTGYMQLEKPPKEDAKVRYATDAVLVKDVDTLAVWATAEGLIRQDEGALMVYRQGNNFSVSKAYVCHQTKNSYCDIRLSWSYNNFACFMVDLLVGLEGGSQSDVDRARFGQVFDRIGPKAE